MYCTFIVLCESMIVLATARCVLVQHSLICLSVRSGPPLIVCRSLRDMMHALDLDGHVVHKPALSTLAESPSQMSSEATSSGSDTGSVTQGLSVAPRANSLKRSPLGRSVVTALEAELDQVYLDVMQLCTASLLNKSCMFWPGNTTSVHFASIASMDAGCKCCPLGSWLVNQCKCKGEVMAKHGNGLIASLKDLATHSCALSSAGGQSKRGFRNESGRSF